LHLADRPGRPTLLPIWGSGLTSVCNQNIDAFNALQRKGLKLSLWLCCDYDLGVYEEMQLGAACKSGHFSQRSTLV